MIPQISGNPGRFKIVSQIILKRKFVRCVTARVALDNLVPAPYICPSSMTSRSEICSECQYPSP